MYGSTTEFLSLSKKARHRNGHDWMKNYQLVIVGKSEVIVCWHHEKQKNTCENAANKLVAVNNSCQQFTVVDE